MSRLVTDTRRLEAMVLLAPRSLETIASHCKTIG